MNLEDFENLTDVQLRQRAMACFEGAGTMQELVSTILLREAKFYLDEIERRNDAFRSRRDFWLEIVIIGLILIEIVFSYLAFREAPKEIAALQATAASLQELEDAYNHVAVDMKWDLKTQKIQVTNEGNTTVEFWGTDLEDGRKFIMPSPFIIVPRATVGLGMQYVYADIQKSLGKKASRTLPLKLYMRDTNGKPFTVSGHFYIYWEKNMVEVMTHMDSIKQEVWTKD